MVGRGGQAPAEGDVVTSLPASVQLPVPAAQQDALDDCEAAAGSMLLQAKGIQVSQDTISASLPRSSGDVSWDAYGNPIWGDPNLGFVGDPSGYGQLGWGGYAIYHAPFAATLAQFAPGRVADISGTDLAGLERELRAGNPVQVWVTVDWGGHVPWVWTLPSGATFEGDRGEHAVVLTGVAPEGFYYNDPYYGTAGNFVSTALFQSVWEFMGRQAVTLR
jgi:uncharacterized protein YvpB